MRRRLRQRRQGVESPTAESLRVAARADPAARGARAARSDIGGRPGGRLGTAIDCFNASQASRLVAGLTRTLGAPSVSVGAAAGTPDEVRITVAWELTWYQWGVDLGAGARPVVQLGNGREIDELDAPARQWNAVALESGMIALAAPGPAGPGTAARR